MSVLRPAGGRRDPQLPPDKAFDVSRIARLSPVITLGFPLGSRTQESTVKVSVTSGHVRRVFENAIQIDSSIYRGNSGGPVIDQRGKVIGIASRAAVDWALGPIPMATLLSDIGQVLPIAPAAAFLDEIRAGRPKWDGTLDPGVEGKLEQVALLVRRKRWGAARRLSEEMAENSTDPGPLAHRHRPLPFGPARREHSFSQREKPPRTAADRSHGAGFLERSRGRSERGASTLQRGAEHLPRRLAPLFLRYGAHAATAPERTDALAGIAATRALRSAISKKSVTNSVSSSGRPRRTRRSPWRIT